MTIVTRRRRTAERAMPYRGPCGLCGGPDARHRVWDTWREQHAAGDNLAWIADDHRTTRAAVLAVVRGPRWWR